MTMTKISIIIPVHNENINIIKVLNSILDLDYKNIEVIIIDDSDDGITDALIRGWLEVHKNANFVRYVHFERRLGVSRARNIGLKLASGDYVFLLDADVLLRKDAISRALKLIASDPNIGAISLLYLHEKPDFLEKVNASRYIGKVKKGPLATGAVMIPKNVIDKVGYFNECLGYPHQVYEDWEYGVRINKAGFKTLIDGTIILTHLRKISLINKINNNNNNPGNNLNIILSRLRGYISRRRAEALFRVLKAGDLKLKLEYSLYALSSWMILLLLFTHALHCFAVFTISYFIGWFIYYLHDFGFTKFKDSLLYTFIIIISRNIRAFALTLWLPLFYIGHMDKCNE